MEFYRDVYSMMIQNRSSALLGVGSTKIQSDSTGRLLYEMPACMQSLLLVSRRLLIISKGRQIVAVVLCLSRCFFQWQFRRSRNEIY